MTEELNHALQKSIENNLHIYKELVLSAYDAGKVLVPTYDFGVLELCRNLVVGEVLRFGKNEVIQGKEHKVYYLTKGGEKMAGKLDAERRKQPSLGLGTGPRAPDTIEVLNEEKPKSEEIGEIEEKHPKKCMEGSQ